jgi:hypothetical protein
MKKDNITRVGKHSPGYASVRPAPYARSKSPEQFSDFSIQHILSPSHDSLQQSVVDQPSAYTGSPPTVAGNLHQRAKRSSDLSDRAEFERHVRVGQQCRTDNAQSSTENAQTSAFSTPSSGVAPTTESRANNQALQQVSNGSESTSSSAQEEGFDVSKRLSVFKTIRNHTHVSIHMCEDRVTGAKLVMKVLRKSRVIDGVAHEFAIQMRLQVCVRVHACFYRRR